MSDAVPDGFEPFPDIGGFVSLTGPYYFGGEEGSLLRYGFMSSEAHGNPNGVVHGGALLTFADTVMGAAVQLVVKRPCATITLNTEFISGARLERWIEARVELTRETSDLAFVRCEVFSGKKTLLTASGIWKLFSKRSQNRLANHNKANE